MLSKARRKENAMTVEDRQATPAEDAHRQLLLTHSKQDIEAFEVVARAVAREEYAAAQREPVVSGDTTGGGCETVTATKDRLRNAAAECGFCWADADQLFDTLARQEARDA